jgi:hypothetical protein
MGKYFGYQKIKFKPKHLNILKELKTTII